MLHAKKSFISGKPTQLKGVGKNSSIPKGNSALGLDGIKNVKGSGKAVDKNSTIKSETTITGELNFFQKNKKMLLIGGAVLLVAVLAVVLIKMKK